MSGHLNTGADGVTLIETLLAAALGTVILTALLALYQRGVMSHAFAASRSALTEKIFIIDRLFADELHVTGGSVCRANATAFNLVNRSSAENWLRPFDRPVQIADGSVTVLKTGIPTALESHDIAKAQLTLTHAAPFERGGLLVVCDNNISVLLQITRTANGKRTFGYAPDVGVQPGNCGSPFGVGGCGPEDYRFDAGALVAPYRPVSFFIATTDGRAPALRRRRLVIANTANGTATARLLSEEVAENVVALKALASVAASAGGVSLTATPHADKVVSLNIGFVAGINTNTAVTLPNKPLYLFGEPVALPAGETPTKHLFASHELSVRL